jgi:hypothetical protein
MLKRKLIAVVLVAAVSLLAGPATTQELPARVQVDLLLTGLEEAIRGGDHVATLGHIDRLRVLDEAASYGELLYFEAEAARGIGNYSRAHWAVGRFLSEVGDRSSNYDAGLELMLRIGRDTQEQILGIEQEIANLDARLLRQKETIDRISREQKRNLDETLGIQRRHPAYRPPHVQAQLDRLERRYTSLADDYHYAVEALNALEQARHELTAELAGLRRATP